MIGSNIIIRHGRPSDLTELQQLFVDTIKTVCKADYSDQQINVWTSSIANKQRWSDIIENQLVLVAQEKDKIIGFCSLENFNYIDLFYVHKDKQGQGVAKQLYYYLESEAIKNGQKQLISDVSITARPFFEKIGFTVMSTQLVIRQEVELTNYKMKKELNSPNR
jgi:putative acetyltransferase